MTFLNDFLSLELNIYTIQKNYMTGLTFLNNMPPMLSSVGILISEQHQKE